jgi:hypothetical protein
MAFFSVFVFIVFFIVSTADQVLLQIPESELVKNSRSALKIFKIVARDFLKKIVVHEF